MNDKLNYTQVNNLSSNKITTKPAIKHNSEIEGNHLNGLMQNQQTTRASPTYKEKYNNIISMLKTNNKKVVKIAVLVIIFCVMAVLYFNITDTDKPAINQKAVNLNYTTSLQYAASIESKLESILGKIRGAQDAKVMVYLEGSLELILAEKVDEKVNSTNSGTSTNSYVTTVTEPIILTNGNISEPLVITEKLPKIKGIVVVCKGAKDIAVKMDILHAIRTLFDIPSGNIEVFAGD